MPPNKIRPDWPGCARFFMHSPKQPPEPPDLTMLRLRLYAWQAVLAAIVAGADVLAAEPPPYRASAA
jgi:hypothetical protein